MNLAGTKICLAIVTSIGALTFTIAVLSFIPGPWLCDIGSQFRLVYPVILLLCGVLQLVLRSPVRAALSVAGAICVAFPVISLMKPASCITHSSDQVVSILNFNTEFQHNDHYELLREVVDRDNPDIIALVEVNKKWIDALESTLRRYPYREIALTGPGVALFSKFPINARDVRYFGKSHHPRILATISIGEKKMNLVVVHPHTPSAGGYEERNQEFSIIRDEIKRSARPVVLIGDLNCGPWSAAFSDLCTAGLHDSEQGFGPQPSWPARNGRVIPRLAIPPLIPIDHVLVSEDICVLKRITGPAIESDHMPVFVRLAVPK